MSTEYLHLIFLFLIFQPLFSFLHVNLIIVLLDLLLSIFFSFGDDIDGIVFNFFKNIIFGCARFLLHSSFL